MCFCVDVMLHTLGLCEATLVMSITSAVVLCDVLCEPGWGYYVIWC